VFTTGEERCWQNSVVGDLALAEEDKGEGKGDGIILADAGFELHVS